jgi:hypothetical protein
MSLDFRKLRCRITQVPMYIVIIVNKIILEIIKIDKYILLFLFL